MSNYILRIRRYLRSGNDRTGGRDVSLSIIYCLILYIVGQLTHGRGLVAAVLAMSFLMSQLLPSRSAKAFVFCAAAFAVTLACQSERMIAGELLFSVLFLCLSLAVVLCLDNNSRALIGLFVFVNVMPYLANSVLGDFTTIPRIETRLSLIDFVDSGAIPWILPAVLVLALLVLRRKR